MTIAEIIEEGERLEREATKGPWVGNVHGEVRAVPLDRLSIGFFSRSYSAGVNGSHEVTADDAEANATFAAFARTALPALLAVAKAAVEAERLTAIFRRDYITAPPDADSTAWTQRAWVTSGEADDAIEKLFAAVRGEGKETT